MTDKRKDKNEIIKVHKQHYEGMNNGLATNEDDLPDRHFHSSEIANKDEYIDEP